MLPSDNAGQFLADLAKMLGGHLTTLARLWERSLEQRERALQHEQERLALLAEVQKTQQRKLEVEEENARRYAESLRRYEQTQRMAKWVGAGLVVALAVCGLGAWVVLG